jgi:hypothetical protein
MAVNRTPTRVKRRLIATGRKVEVDEGRGKD